MKYAFLKYLIYSILVVCISGCSTSQTDPQLLEEGVSLKLAKFRKKNYERLSYKLFFSIPKSKKDPLMGEVEISFLLKKTQPIIIDFRVDSSKVLSVKRNDKNIDYKIFNEHIYIDSKEVSIGENKINISFIPNDQSLNRRDDFLYTLLVPDRARTLFPCFDQPDMKALFTLELEIPNEWTAISNSPLDILHNSGDRKHLSFKETEPLSTYLFSFVAGNFYDALFEKDGRKINIYHREVNPEKCEQLPDLADEVFYSLRWLEDYTGIPYPFAKYDLIILPGFQYGGMEHTGATLYNDRRMFLNEHPTLNEKLNRSSLIAHETAHMWFGDYVTMEWFDDVWTKEVFAGYFSSKIVEPLYPEVNHKLNYLLSYFPSSYAEDRTQGTTPVKQSLTNLNNAGLVYGNIIYNKSPIVFDMLVKKMGENHFRQGIKEYLKTFAYGNATWEGLINILDKYTENDLKNWSRIWIHEKGMPTIETSLQVDSVAFTQSDPWKRGIVWPQEISSMIIKETPIPNIDGMGYGFFKLDEQQINQSVHLLETTSDEILHASLLITLHENLLNQTINPNRFMKILLSYIKKEQNPLLFSLALSQINNCQHLFQVDRIEMENILWDIIITNSTPELRLQTFRLYRSLAESEASLDRLYSIWKYERPPSDCELSETDYINLSYILAIRIPDKADKIIEEQLNRISNPDRITEYLFISPSVSPKKEDRDSVFRSLLNEENRRVEPWAATSLSYLNHNMRQKEAIDYIRPALDELEDIQRTGDIFFPTAWLRSLLSGHISDGAKAEITLFLKENPDYPPMLLNKIKQQTDYLSIIHK